MNQAQSQTTRYNVKNGRKGNPTIVLSKAIFSPWSVKHL